MSVPRLPSYFATDMQLRLYFHLITAHMSRHAFHNNTRTGRLGFNRYSITTTTIDKLRKKPQKLGRQSLFWPFSISRLDFIDHRCHSMLTRPQLLMPMPYRCFDRTRTQGTYNAAISHEAIPILRDVDWPLALFMARR